MSETFEHLGPYRVGELLGRGGMGNVYSGQHVKTGQNVAVKVISPTISEEPRFRRRFATEIEALKLLSHPSIVKLIGYGEEEGILFYSMELIEGETLQKVIRREKRLPWPQVIDLAIRICSGLKHAHDIGVTHRDLKPANLILTGNEDWPIKIVDFGIPKIFGDTTDQTYTGSILGTPDYMAPEQANGGVVNAKTDLYCLGSTIYAALSGRPPFRGKNVTDVITKLKREEPPDLRELNLDSDLPAELRELICELLRKDPKTRPPTALVVMNRLKAISESLRAAGTMVDSPKTIAPGYASEQAMTLETGQHGSDNDVTFAVGNQAAKGIAPFNIGSNRTALDTDSQKNADAENHGERSNPSVVHRGHMEPGTNELGFASEEEAIEQKTHFETVDDKPLRSRVFDDASESQSAAATWLPALGLVAIVATIIGIVAMQLGAGPNADELYTAAMENRDQDAAKIFLREYADDERHPEVELMLMQDRLSAVVRRIKTRKRIGASSLQPSEDSFLDAGSLWTEGEPGASEAFTRWVTLFGDDVKVENDLLELAHFFSGRDNDHTDESEDPRLEPLREKMTSWRELPTDTQTQRLEDLIETFDGKIWAAVIIEEAQVRLMELKKTESANEGGEETVFESPKDSS
ncbi:MAG: serine/threonine-protein kinase [Planctomycetota bacterium]